MSLNLTSGLWIDEPDALDELERRVDDGSIEIGKADRLRRFVLDGYVSFPLTVDSSVIESLSTSYDGLWQARDSGLAYAFDGPPRRFEVAEEGRERLPGYRIHDPHSHLDAAKTLYLHPEIHEFARDIFDEEVVAIQSLLFEYGSEQTIHRDPITVPTGKPLHLFAAWIALEEITEECGPLLYVPRSHRLPYYEFEPGKYMFDESTMGAAEIERGLAFYHAEFEKRGLQPETNTARRGEVLFWHPSLFHGGAPVSDPTQTRKSFVVHLTSRSSYPERSITIREPDESGTERSRVLATTETEEQNGRFGFHNPMSGRVR